MTRGTGPAGGADCVIAHCIPPEELSYGIADGAEPTSLAAVWNVTRSLRPHGRAVVMLPEGLLYQRGNEESLRRTLLEGYRIEEILHLPLRQPASLREIKSQRDGPEAILVFRREQPARSVFFQQARTEGAGAGGNTTIDVEATFAQSQTRQESGSSWLVPVDRLMDGNADLLVRLESDMEMERLFREIADVVPGLVRCRLKEIAVVHTGVLVPPCELTKTAPDTVEVGGVTMANAESIPVWTSRGSRRHGLQGNRAWLREGGRNWAILARGTGELRERFEQRYCPKKGDLLVAAEGNIGACELLYEADRAVIRDDIHLVRPLEDPVVDGRIGAVMTGYVYQLLRTKPYRNWLREHAHGVRRKHLSRRSLLALELPLPSEDIQQRVAMALRRDDRCRDNVVAAFREASEAGKKEGEARGSRPAFREAQRDREELAETCNWLLQDLREASIQGAPYAQWLSRLAGLFLKAREAAELPNGIAKLLRIKELLRQCDVYEEEYYASGNPLPDLYIARDRVGEILADEADRVVRIEETAKSASQLEIADMVAHNLRGKLGHALEALSEVQRFIREHLLANTALYDARDPGIVVPTVGQTLDLAQRSLYDMRSFIDGTLKAFQGIDPTEFEDSCILEVLAGGLCNRSFGEPSFGLTVDGAPGRARIHVGAVVTAVACVIKNAQDHAFCEGAANAFRITVREDRDEGTVDVHCWNNGRPFPKEIGLKEYTGMYRKSTSSRGHGLGGAFVGRVMQAHEGEIWIEHPAEGGEVVLRFRMLLDSSNGGAPIGPEHAGERATR